jgi:hypothetical protein
MISDISPKGRMRVITDLQLVEELIVLFKRSEWIQGTNAANGKFKRVPTDWDANSFCLRGACIKVIAPDRGLIATAFTMDNPVSAQIPRALGFKTNAEVVVWNDAKDRTYADIMTLLKRRRREIPVEEAAREKERQKKAELQAAHQAKIKALTAATRKSAKKENGNGK